MQQNDWKVQIIGIYLSQRDITLYSIVLKIVHDLDTLMINLYNTFHLSRYYPCKENDRKLKKKVFFPMFMGHRSINNCLIVPKIIKFHFDIIMINLNTKFR